MAPGAPDLPNGRTFVQDECAPNFVCAPTLKVEDPDACFAPCTTNFSADPYLIGACVPSYRIRDQNPGAVGALEQLGCKSNELCTPCANPLQPGQPSHACD